MRMLIHMRIERSISRISTLKSRRKQIRLKLVSVLDVAENLFFAMANTVTFTVVRIFLNAATPVRYDLSVKVSLGFAYICIFLSENDAMLKMRGILVNKF